MRRVPAFAHIVLPLPIWFPHEAIRSICLDKLLVLNFIKALEVRISITNQSISSNLFELLIKFFSANLQHRFQTQTSNKTVLWTGGGRGSHKVCPDSLCSMSFLSDIMLLNVVMLTNASHVVPVTNFKRTHLLHFRGNF